MNLYELIGDRKPTRADWRLLADNWGVLSDYTLEAIAPDGVACKACWDTGLCAECLGEYPALCPAGCINGTCRCRKIGDE